MSPIILTNSKAVTAARRGLTALEPLLAPALLSGLVTQIEAAFTAIQAPARETEMIARFMAVAAAEKFQPPMSATGLGGWASANWRDFLPQAERLSQFLLGAGITEAAVLVSSLRASGEPISGETSVDRSGVVDLRTFVLHGDRSPADAQIIRAAVKE